MITRYRAWMDDKALDEIADSIYIIDIQEMDPEQNVISMGLAGMHGSFLQSNFRLALQVLIRLQIREYDTAKRKEVLGKVLAWAQGEELVISDRPGKKLTVTLDAAPAISSLKWTETITLSFTAREFPFWHDDGTTLVFSGTSDSQEITVEGNFPSHLGGFISNSGTTAITTMSISAGEQSMVLENLNLLPDGMILMVEVGYGGLYLLQMDDNGVAYLMGNIAEDSAYGVEIEPNTTTTVTLTADGTVTAMLTAQGVWL